jgi:catechol 2,3-dioxygenase-like lactoylglutathione lyase family enzyme
MLHHASLEIAPTDRAAAIEFWGLLGFEPVPEPEPLAGHVAWVERAGTQIHLIFTDAPSVPALGHVAVAVADFDGALDAVRTGGHEIVETRELWGARRAFAVSPGGHRVELMESPPPAVR